MIKVEKLGNWQRAIGTRTKERKKSNPPVKKIEEFENPPIHYKREQPSTASNECLN